MVISFHTSLINTFKKIIEINNKNIIYSEEFNIPISNKYYIFLFDNSDDLFINLSKYIIDEEIDSKYDFSELNCSLTFDQEQILSINILNNDITKTEIELNNLFLCAEESDAEIILSFDINFIKNYSYLIDSQDGETHLLDYLFYKLYNKLSNIIIFDEISFLSCDSLFYFELSKCLFDTTIFKQTLNKINLIKSDKIIVYKKPDNIYWNFFDYNNNYDINFNDQNISYEKFTELLNNNNFINTIINNNLVIVTKIFINQILFINIFNKNDHDKEPFPIDPLSKNFIKF